MAAPTNLLSLIVIGICCSAAVQGGETSDQRGQCTKAGLTRSYSIRSITIDSNGKKYIHYVPNEREVNQTITWVTRASVTSTDACAKEANNAGAAMFRFMGQSCSTSSDAYSGICDNSCDGRVEAKPDLSVYTLKHCQALTPATATPQTTTTTTAAATTTATTPTTPAATTTPTTTAAATTTSAGVIIAGGWNIAPLSDVEAFDTGTLPNLPNPTVGLSLSLIGAEIFACGGYVTGNENSNKCYSINISSNAASWKSLNENIPVSMRFHTASVIGSHIWLVYNNVLYDLDSATDDFTTRSLPFEITSGRCAVSNGTHAYVIGAGTSEDEIWINTEASNPAKWHQVATMAVKRKYHGCLWIEGKIFITGGIATKRDVVVLDTATNSLQATGSLIDNRHAHGMLVLNGEPAVIGGVTGSGYSDSSETYNSATGKWTKNNRTLEHTRYGFGLVQLQE